jgi:hypothetical protein
MPGIEDLSATREALRELIRVVNSTRQTLAALIQAPERAATTDSSGRFSETLEHLGEVREGFILSQRTSPHLSLAELRSLVQAILLDWEWLQEMDLGLAPNTQLELLDQQLVAYNHTVIALGVLPRLPAEAITFPQQPRPSYGDLTVPVLPGEMLARIEEIEKMIYQAEIRPIKTLAYGPLRRTYAFFEASSWLANNYLGPLLDERRG